MVASHTDEAAKVCSPKTMRRKRKHALKVSTRKIFLGIRCIAPGKTVPTQGICVEEKAILGEVLNAWAAGLLNGRCLPPEAKVTGASENEELSLKFPLDLIRKNLPVKNGRLTVSVNLPAKAFDPPPETPEPKPKAKSEVLSVKKPSKANKEPQQMGAGEPKQKEEVNKHASEAAGGDRSQQTQPEKDATDAKEGDSDSDGGEWVERFLG
mmetsp:Transcript_59657/g.106042  ORF Transcript_59657/g.106042 Transcript_59657/m.106042 type:complete len:210 (+) Transcript_59657:100-729(+)